MNLAASSNQILEKKKIHRNIDMFIKQSIGAISSMEYKRRTIINDINLIHYVDHKTSLPFNLNYVSSVRPGTSNFVQDVILSMEVDPLESRCLLTISKYNSVTIFNISSDAEVFEVLMREIIPHDPMDIYGIPNSAHWLWDGTVFSVGTKDSVHFWDSNTCERIETIKLRTRVLNHVFAAKKNSMNKYVGVTGVDGHVFLIDLRHGLVVSTMKNVESSPIKAIDWHPYNELKYITGNNNGNIFLWDIRFQKRIIFKFSNDEASLSTSHFHSVIGLRFYNDGNNVMSIDEDGYIKTWEINTGKILPNYYDRLLLSNINKKNPLKDYQFAVTEHLKQDFAFLPSEKGMRIFDIDSGKHFSSIEDIFLPINCATYDSQKVCVYGGADDIVKSWAPQHRQIDV